ncbi:N-acetylneuraminate (7)9-O-acetyltransferase isoform X2 [Parasteatoda tepidariorum]|uniref:N-acetylneuraminate (7)9-O-acetyltransferase isoform X2 n=1 Tax=Parasteatoda tepidariorum TaxID=114398 RepID=UPI001C718F97|nr:N-acetylneuraminate 9-O-acetyltransferase isoform X2 [Parasteatoda tepidariorum]
MTWLNVHDPREIAKHINSRNAKFLALFIVTGFIAYHGILHLTSGIDSCKWLLSDGRFQGFSVWQPYGCMMHSYSSGDSRMCLQYIAYWGGKTYIVFIGDSRVRQLFYSFVSLIDPKYVVENKYVHHDLQFSDEELKVNVEFIWSPMVNETMYDIYKPWQEDFSTRPSLIVTGSGLWAIKLSNASIDMFYGYERNLTYLVPILNSLTPATKILWVLQDPVQTEKLDPSKKMITNEQIDMYNKAAMDVLHGSKVLIWSSSRLVSQVLYQDQVDGLHMGKNALNYAIQILLNMYCNDHMNYNDGTCCSSPEPITVLQLITFSFLGVSCCIALAMVVHYRWIYRKIVPANDQILPSQVGNGSQETTLFELCTALGRLGIVMSYFFLCDRTNFFMKENKYFSYTNFFLPLGYLFVLGIFFTEESQYTQVLHRDQTNEWKGWMQLLILIYHMTGASRVLPIYMHIRVLVTSYLFLSGYGHFTYFYQYGDFGFYRLWQVLFRLNFLVVVLCLCMNRPYQFYYFVPLVSFWFVVMFITVKSVPQVTAPAAEANPLLYFYMVLKFVALFGIVTVLYMSESVAAGMLFAFGLHSLKQNHIIDDKNRGNLFSRGISLSAASAALLGISIYAMFAFLCRNKMECNEIHPYISFVPILSYLTLRNVGGYLRTKYSTFFAWFGNISLELFIAQYHIWLSADTHGILVLVPGYPVLNALVTSFIFVCVAHEIHCLTDILVKYAVPNDWKYLTRNVTFFCLLLVPIGIHDGMF